MSKSVLLESVDTDKTLTSNNRIEHMRRRPFLTAVSTGLALPISGCSTTSEPDIEQVQRLGAADPISLSDPVQVTNEESSDRSFAEQATNRAVEAAVSRLREILQQEALTGEGISVGHGVVELTEIDLTDTELPSASEFNRATNRSPIVFHHHHYSRDGDLISEPPVPFESIVDETPRSISVTVTDSSQEYVAVLPVMCERGWIQNS